MIWDLFLNKLIDGTLTLEYRIVFMPMKNKAAYSKLFTKKGRVRYGK